MRATPTPIKLTAVGPDGVEIVNDEGWGLAMPWEDAIRCAHTILAGAYARRMLVERDKVCDRCGIGDHRLEELVEHEPRSCTCPCACLARESERF